MKLLRFGSLLAASLALGLAAPAMAQAPKVGLGGNINEVKPVSLGTGAIDSTWKPLTAAAPMPISPVSVVQTMKMTVTLAGGSYAQGNNVGGRIGIDLGDGNKKSLIRRLTVSTTSSASGASSWGFRLWDASPDGGTVTDRTQLTLSAADLAHCVYGALVTPALGSAGSEAAPYGLTYLAVNGVPIAVTTDAAGKFWVTFMNYGAAQTGIDTSLYLHVEYEQEP